MLAATASGPRALAAAASIAAVAAASCLCRFSSTVAAYKIAQKRDRQGVKGPGGRGGGVMFWIPYLTGTLTTRSLLTPKRTKHRVFFLKGGHCRWPIASFVFFQR